MPETGQQKKSTVASLAFRLEMVSPSTGESGLATLVGSRALERNSGASNDSPGSEELNNAAQEGFRPLTSEDESLGNEEEATKLRVLIFAPSTSASKNDAAKHVRRRSNLELELRAKTRDNDSLTSRLFEFERERVELAEERDLLKEELAAKTNRIADLEARVGALVSESDRAKAKLAVSKVVDEDGLLAAAEAQCKLLKGDREVLATQNRILRNQMDACVTSLKKSDERNNLYRIELSNAKMELRHFQNLLPERGAVGVGSERKSAGFRSGSNNTDDSSPLGAANRADDVEYELRCEVVDLTSRLSAAGFEILGLKDTVAKLDAGYLAGLETETIQLKAEVSHLDSELISVKSAHKVMRSLLSASKKVQAMACARVKQLEHVEAENSDLKATLAILRKSDNELQVLKGVNKSMLSVMEATKMRQTTLVQGNRDLEKKLRITQEQLNQAKLALVGHGNQVVSLEKFLEKAEAEVRVLKSVSHIDKALIKACNNQKSALMDRERNFNSMLEKVKLEAAEKVDEVMSENIKLSEELDHAQTSGRLSNIDLVALAMGGLIFTLLFAFFMRM